jgi:hypothetical protein
MKRFATLLLPLAIATTLLAADPATAPTAEKEEGFTPIFNGKDLSEWSGDDIHWSVVGGVLKGEATKETMVKGGNTFLIWKGFDGKDGKNEVADFELRLSAKLVGGNSGIQYRSFTRPEKFVVGGYQMEISTDPKSMGKVYGELFRGQMAAAGEKTSYGAGGKKTEKLPDYKTDTFKKDDWNDYRIVCRGSHIQQYINGVLTVDLTDEAKDARSTGLIALQIHQGYVMTVEFKNIRLKKLTAP